MNVSEAELDRQHKDHAEKQDAEYWASKHMSTNVRELSELINHAVAELEHCQLVLAEMKGLCPSCGQRPHLGPDHGFLCGDCEQANDDLLRSKAD